ncbi:phosphoadenylyl-sulfate reductase [Pontibacillus yanchengensis]|uniref:Adenosine 5'-phosphosulfate reductase n=1 Tax=Pontibacillus yanchengensis TaxID=462910 RepID=A0A6I5A1Y7_9BACI|nr:phosphoadenylyl-sulfate reductase [Pontibacillus yanchengensis]
MTTVTHDNWETSEKPVFDIMTPTKGAQEVLEWSYHHYGDDIVYACSFGVEGMVMIDLIARVKPTARIIFLDTGIHFKETYELIDRVKERYPELQIKMVKPHLTLDEQAEEYGEALWERKPNKCCNIRKIIPLEKELSQEEAWISGLRREQSPSRASTDFLNKDDKFKAVKVCPLIHWTWQDIWNYVRKEDLPYNPLHEQGYPSIGCSVCTAKVTDSVDSRAGRWANTDKTECGLHSDS